MVSKRDLSVEEQKAMLKEQSPGLLQGPNEEQLAKLAELRGLAEVDIAQKKANASSTAASVDGYIGAPYQGVVTSKKFKLKDGRIIVLSPPKVPNCLILPSMFADREKRDLKFATDYQNAGNFRFIHKIDDRVIPQPMDKWSDIASLMHDLGEQAIDFVLATVEKYWGGDATTYGTELLD